MTSRPASGTRSGRELAVLDQDQFAVAAAFSPGGDYLATSVIYHHWFHLYRITGRRERMRLIGHPISAHAVAFHPRLARMASGDESGGIILWDSAAGIPLRRMECPQHVQALAFSPDGSILASGAYGADLRLWNANDGSLLRSLSGHEDVVSALAFDRAGSRIASATSTGRVLLHEVATGAQLPHKIALQPGRWIPSLDFSDDGRQLLVQDVGGSFRVVDLAGNARPRPTSVPGPAQSMVSDPGRSRVVGGTLDGGLAAVSLPDLRTVLRVQGHHRERVIVVALSPDGNLIASGGRMARSCCPMR